MSKRARLSCTTSPQVAEALNALLWTGLWGRTRAEVVERLVCHAIQSVAPPEFLKAIAHEIATDNAGAA